MSWFTVSALCFVIIVNYKCWCGVTIPKKMKMLCCTVSCRSCVTEQNVGGLLTEYALIYRLLCLPASSAGSAPVERIFSKGEITVRPHGTKIGDMMLELLMYLCCNNSYWSMIIPDYRLYWGNFSAFYTW